jgi:hypothetical protein
MTPLGRCNPEPEIVRTKNGALAKGSRFFTFLGRESGLWRVVSMEGVQVDPLLEVARLDVSAGGLSMTRNKQLVFPSFTTPRLYGVSFFVRSEGEKRMLA